MGNEIAFQKNGGITLVSIGCLLVRWITFPSLFYSPFEYDFAMFSFPLFKVSREQRIVEIDIEMGGIPPYQYI